MEYNVLNNAKVVMDEISQGKDKKSSGDISGSHVLKRVFRLLFTE